VVSDIDGNFLYQLNPSVELTSTIGDMVGRPVVPSTLESTQRKGVMRLDGQVLIDDLPWIYKFENYPFIGGAGEVPERSLLPVNSGWYLDLIAGTNPSRPVFTPPQVLQDIIELPKLLRETGSLLRKPSKLLSPKEAANAHLAGRFGWAPLIEDLIKVIGLQKTILKRNKELRDLYSGKGIKRRLKFANETKTTKSVHLLAYGSTLISADVHQVVRKDQWGTINWKPTDPPPFHPSDEERNKFALRLALGLTVEGMAKGAWDVIPWTWLLGWFTNVGKYTLLHSNTVPAVHSGACLMNRVVSTSFPGMVTVKNSKAYLLSPTGAFVHSTKTRVAASGAVLPGFNMPYLDMSRLSVLASLFVQRMR
jgi:hypothetical protein